MRKIFPTISISNTARLTRTLKNKRKEILKSMTRKRRMRMKRRKNKMKKMRIIIELILTKALIIQMFLQITILARSRERNKRSQKLRRRK